MITALTKHRSDIGLIGHTICDYPSPEIARSLIEIMVNNGVQLIELQIPFTEPIADGPVFLKANHEAIKNGVSLENCFELMQEVTNRFDIPFVFMTYANIIFHYGYENFVRRAKKAGAYGAIVPDLPPDLAEDYLTICKKHDFASIQIFPPNMQPQRVELLAKNSQGFNYVVARAGVTGKHSEFNNNLQQQIQAIQQYNDLPIAVGFGVQSKKDTEQLKAFADYAIIGTKALQVYQEQGLAGVETFWQQF